MKILLNIPIFENKPTNYGLQFNTGIIGLAQIFFFFRFNNDLLSCSNMRNPFQKVYPISGIKRFTEIPKYIGWVTGTKTFFKVQEVIFGKMRKLWKFKQLIQLTYYPTKNSSFFDPHMRSSQ